jgi:hypothetical protein
MAVPDGEFDSLSIMRSTLRCSIVTAAAWPVGCVLACLLGTKQSSFDTLNFVDSHTCKAGSRPLGQYLRDPDVTPSPRRTSWIAATS